MLQIAVVANGEEEQVLSLIKRSFDMNVSMLYSPEGIQEFYKYLNLESFIFRQQNDHQTYVARADGEIVGVLELRRKNHIAMLFVDNSHKGRGIGKALLCYVEYEVLGRKGLVTVNSAPNAVGFYMSKGFKAIAPEETVHGIRFTRMEKELAVTQER